MRFTIRHLIIYRYDRPVFPEPHLIRLRPRSDVRQRLLSHELRIGAAGVRRAEGVDIWGGASTLVWFDDPVETLIFEAFSTVETDEGNPFDFILADAGDGLLPLVYRVDEATELAPCLAAMPVGPGVAALVDEGRRATDDNPLVFPVWLAARIRDRVAHSHRDEPGLLDPETILATAEGSCRDMAALFVAACRSVGIAARFVSGYQAGEEEIDRRELHGWAEVYLPGGGWRGYDPAGGIACGGEHVALASASAIGMTGPVTGSFRGEGTSRMSYEVTVTREA